MTIENEQNSSYVAQLSRSTLLLYNLENNCLICCHLQNFALENKPGSVGSFNLTKGVNKFCLLEPGVYQLTPVSCHQFEQAVYSYDTYVIDAADYLTFCLSSLIP